MTEGKTTALRGITVAVLDNDVLAAQAMCMCISRLSPAFRIAWWTGSATGALHRCLSEPAPPQVLVTDMALDDMPGVVVCETIRRETDAIGIIGVTAYTPDSFMPALADAGAQALIPKEKAVSPLMLRAIRRAAEGQPADEDGSFMDARTAHRLLAASKPRIIPLSPAEKSILSCFLDGMSVDDICNQYGITRNTVYTHTRRAVAKLGVKTRAEALVMCRRWHLLEGTAQ